MKNKMGKTAKTFVVISIVWILMIYSLASGSYSFDEGSFIGWGIIPLVVGWGIYWIRRK